MASHRHGGPKTPEGKARSSRNALKHGLLARDAVLPCEDPAEFDALLTSLEVELQPSTPMERFYVWQIADAQWRLRRIVRIETGLIADRMEDLQTKESAREPKFALSEEEEREERYDSKSRTLGRSFADTCAYPSTMVNVTRHEASIRRGLYQAIQSLERIRDPKSRLRPAAPAPAEIASRPPGNAVTPAESPASPEISERTESRKRTPAPPPVPGYKIEPSCQQPDDRSSPEPSGLPSCASPPSPSARPMS